MDGSSSEIRLNPYSILELHNDASITVKRGAFNFYTSSVTLNGNANISAINGYGTLGFYDSGFTLNDTTSISLGDLGKIYIVDSSLHITENAWLELRDLSTVYIGGTVNNYSRGEIRGPTEERKTAAIVKNDSSSTSKIVNYNFSYEHDLTPESSCLKYDAIDNLTYYVPIISNITGNVIINDEVQMFYFIIDKEREGVKFKNIEPLDRLLLLLDGCAETPKVMTFTNPRAGAFEVSYDILNDSNKVPSIFSSEIPHSFRVKGEVNFTGDLSGISADGTEMTLDSADVEFSRNDSLPQVPIRVINNSEMTFPKGEFSVNKDIEVEKESKLIIEEGAIVTMKAGSSLIL
jgi:hypothetical protein